MQVKGVLDVESGYSNGHTAHPTYEQVCTGTTGHNEVVKLIYDPQVISVQDILEIFFVIHDPTTLNAQGNDRGTQYRSGIYVTTPEQVQVANELIAEMPVSYTHLDVYKRQASVDPACCNQRPERAFPWLKKAAVPEP